MTELQLINSDLQLECRPVRHSNFPNHPAVSHLEIINGDDSGKKLLPSNSLGDKVTGLGPCPIEVGSCHWADRRQLDAVRAAAASVFPAAAVMLVHHSPAFIATFAEVGSQDLPCPAVL